MTQTAGAIRPRSARAGGVSREAEQAAQREQAEYSGGKDLPLGGYGALLGVYGISGSALALLLARNRRALSRRITAADLALLSVATFKLSRLFTKDSVTSMLRVPFARFEGQADVPSEVRESVRGRGLRKAVGELLTCPFCMGQWLATAFVAGHLLAPRATRAAACTLTVTAVADGLQLAYSAAGGKLS